MPARIVELRWNGHEALDVQTETHERADKGGRGVWRATTLLFLIAHVDLDQHSCAGRVAGDDLSDLETIDGVPQRDRRGDRFDLVALQAADEMPSQRLGVRREGVEFDFEFLRAVLAELALTGGCRLEHRRGVNLFGHRNERDVARVATGGTCRVGDASTDVGQTRRDVGHQSTTMVA